MKCPKCGASIQGNGDGNGKSNVVDSRSVPDNSIRRRRECLNCGARVTTYEMIESNPNCRYRRGVVMNKVAREGLVNLIAYATALLEGELDAPEVEETDRPQREPESGQVDSAVGVGSSR